MFCSMDGPGDTVLISENPDSSTRAVLVQTADPNP